MALDCLNGLVGLSQRNCDCVSGGRPSGWNDSSTGYYLDDRVYGVPVKEALSSNLDCGEDNIWDLLTEARTNGIRDMKSDLLQTLNTERESRVVNWRGLIGKTENTGSYITGSTKVGIQLRPRKRMKDAYFQVKALWINVNATKSVTMGIASNDGTFSSVTQSVAVTANEWTRCEFSSEVSLPLYSIGKQDLRYHVYYEPDGARSRQNRLWCCSKPAWLQHFDYGAFSLADLPADNVIPSNNDAYGLAIEGYFTCNKLDWICDLPEMNGLDLRDLIGRLIQYRSAIHAITAILRSGQVNKYTMLGVEGLSRQRNSLMSRYDNDIRWVAQNLPAGVTSCWGCEKSAPQVMNLIS